MIKKNINNPDILNLRPRKLYPFEFGDKGRVVVLVPEYKSKLAEWFIPKNYRTNIKVKLDLMSSAVWDYCDGKKTVKDIADRMRQDYGTFAEPVDKKVRGFINELQAKKIIDIGTGTSMKSNLNFKNK